MKTHNNNIDTRELWEKLYKNLRGFEDGKSGNMVAQVTHFVSSYQSQYYGYLWSKVYAQDLFSKFKKDGIFNQTTGMLYRKKVFAPGGTKTGM